MVSLVRPVSASPARITAAHAHLRSPALHACPHCSSTAPDVLKNALSHMPLSAQRMFVYPALLSWLGAVTALTMGSATSACSLVFISKDTVLLPAPLVTHIWTTLAKKTIRLKMSSIKLYNHIHSLFLSLFWAALFSWPAVCPNSKIIIPIWQDYSILYLGSSKRQHLHILSIAITI